MLMFILLLSSFVSAKDLTVEKSVAEEELSTGGSATVQLEFTNPYGVEVPVVIVDKNILGNNGVDVECLEFTVPVNEHAVVRYDPIELFSAGDFSLDGAFIAYVDPETLEQKNITTDDLDVSVSGSGVTGTQAITNIYQCNGQNKKSTSKKQSSQQQSEEQQKAQQQSNEERMKEIQKQAQDQMQQKKDAVQNNQMDQDAGALKEEMQRQREEFQKMQQEFAKQMSENPEFAEQHEKMLREGYNVTNAEVDPETNDTGNFKVNYQRPNGEKAALAGSMQNGTMEEFQKQSAADERMMREQLANNPEFQKFSEELAREGFNETSLQMNLDGNKTEVVMNYQNPDGREASITSDFVNQTIEKVELEKEEKKDYSRLSLLGVVLVLLFLAAYLLYRKYFVKPVDSQGNVVVPEKPVNYRKESRKMIEKAKKLFDDKKEKDAYEMVGRAIRFFYTHKLGYKRELTNTCTIDCLRRHKMDHKSVQSCLGMCGMVEFARYKANRRDFNSIVKSAENIVK
ncbi:hypothetical protein ACFL3V_05470 [Nanoarchaeota archaeon]